MKDQFTDELKTAIADGFFLLDRVNRTAIIGAIYTTGIHPRAAIVGDRTAQTFYQIVAVYAGGDRTRYVGDVTSVTPYTLPVTMAGSSPRMMMSFANF